MNKSILVLWQFPQVLLGFLVKLFTRAKARNGNSLSKGYVYNWRYDKGLSLSNFYMFVNKHATQETIFHEKGHAKQSIMLGPFYLLIVGIPSFLWALLYSHIKLDVSYYWFYTEAWADKLCNIKRS